jgi:hypothetical protein
MSGSGREGDPASRWRRVEGWFFGSAPVRVMVVNRIVLGGVILLHAISRVPEFGLLYGSASAAWSQAYREFVARILAPQVGLRRAARPSRCTCSSSPSTPCPTTAGRACWPHSRST